jgi:hypothetical protein
MTFACNDLAHDTNSSSADYLRISVIDDLRVTSS